MEKTSFPTPQDVAWLTNNQPRLRAYATSRGLVIKGMIDIAKEYNGHTITDSYKIEIRFEKPTHQPTIKEIGGRLDTIMKERKITNPADLHIYTTGNLCVMTPQEMQLVYLPTPTLEGLFERYILPYFYSQSYFEAFRRWPWEHYAHNFRGIFDWYTEHNTIPGAATETAIAIKRLDTDSSNDFCRRVRAANSFTPQSRCICGSQRSYIRCGNHLYLLRLAAAIKHP